MRGKAWLHEPSRVRVHEHEQWLRRGQVPWQVGEPPHEAQLLAHEPERRLDIDWHEMAGERFIVRLAMEGTDRRGLYADVAAAVSATGTDIKSLELKTTDGRVTGSAMVEVENLAHLDRIMKAARRVKGIAAVSRREKITAEE